MRPALVVVDFGFNDRRWVPADDTDEPERFARQYAAERITAKNVVRALSFWHTVGALQALVERISPQDSAAKVDRLDRVMPRVDGSQYRENLAAIATVARAAGANVLFLRIPDEPKSASELHEGVALLERQAYDSAIVHLRLGAADSGFNGDLSTIFLAKALYAIDDPAGADEALRISPVVPELDGKSPVRLESTYARILRQVGDSLGVPVFDATNAQNAEPGSYIDDNHLSLAGHRRLGLALVPVVKTLSMQAVGVS